ncbi:MAG: DNA mismatch repair endonuclease MutL [Pirellulaceae bacterium]
MTHIQKLPPHVVNQIAAGEVIERPASVVKELLENAVDAGANRMDVTLEQGGATYVRVADNGSGIAADELMLAVTSHATSKLRTADDLFRVHTLGFRGEALASIASVGQLLIRSRTAEDQAGAELEVVGGRPSDVAPCGCPPGTIIEVRNLFYNTPVRRKYLRTTQTELGHASEAFTRAALAHPDHHFTFRHQNRSLYELPPVEDWRERITTLFGQELAEGLLWIEGSRDGVCLSGYVATPSLSRGNNRMQYLFLNGRPIRDRSLQHALGEAYRGLLVTGRYPIAFLRLEMPPEMIDVNVHPTKLEVRFQDGGRVYSQLLGTLRSRFLSTDLTAKVQPAGFAGGSIEDVATDPQQLQRHQDELRAWARGEEPPARSADGPASQSRLPLSTGQGATPAFRPFQDRSSAFHAPEPRSEFPDDPADAQNRSSQDPGTDRRLVDSPPPIGSGPIGVQLHSRYLVTENDEGMVVIDQHALHERVIYEQLRERVLDGKLETQRLLVPEPVPLTAAEAAAVLDARDTLAHLGMEIEPFGGDTVLVSAYPAMLANISPADVLRQVIELLLGDGGAPQRRDLLDELLHMISCKAAIKAGDRLSSEEVESLLEQRHLYRDTHHCPHGRPTALVFTREELDRRFKRI